MILVLWSLFLYSLYCLLAILLKVKPNQNILYCGLVGYSGKAVADALIIKLLMLYNKERGTDSTGLLIDGTNKKDAVSVDKFLPEVSNLFTADNTTTIIGHTRSASAGIAKTRENAHPFSIKKNAESPAELFLAMNGTITNMYELEKKYDMGWAHGDSDSKYLAFIMTELGRENFTEVLTKYEGAANLLFYFNGDKNTLMVFKDPGRTLYYWKTKKGMYISSMAESLYCAGAALADVHEFEDYNLYKIVEGNIVEQTVVREPKKASTYQQCNMYQHRGSENFNRAYGYAEDSSVGQNVIVFNPATLRYTRNDVMYTGEVMLNRGGEIYDKSNSSHDRDKFETYQFFEGYLLKNSAKYNDLMRRYKRGGKINKKEFKNCQASELSTATRYPVPNRSRTIYYYDGRMIASPIAFKPFLHDEMLRFDSKGRLIQTEESQNVSSKITGSELDDFIYNILSEGTIKNLYDLKTLVRNAAGMDNTVEADNTIVKAFLRIMRLERAIDSEQFMRLNKRVAELKLQNKDYYECDEAIEKFISGEGVQENSEALAQDTVRKDIITTLYDNPKFIFDFDNNHEITSYRELSLKWCPDKDSPISRRAFLTTVLVMLNDRDKVELSTVSSILESEEEDVVYGEASYLYAKHKKVLTK